MIVCDWDVTWWFINCWLVELNWGWLVLCWIDRLNLLYIRFLHYTHLLTLPQHAYRHNHKEYYSSNICSVHINYPCFQFRKSIYFTKPSSNHFILHSIVASNYIFYHIQLIIYIFLSHHHIF